MSKTRSGGKSNERGAKAGDWKRLVSAGALVAAVAGTLIVAAVLRAGPDPLPVQAETAPREGGERSADDRALSRRPVAPAPSPAPALESGTLEESRPVAEPGAAARPTGDPLPLRSSRDRDRMAAHATDWTLQFARLCEPEHASSLLAELGARDELYLIERDGCYLVCWGMYGSADLARAARNLPSTLTRLPDRPFPKRVGDALR
jgi:hypothetical protein